VGDRGGPSRRPPRKRAWPAAPRRGRDGLPAPPRVSARIGRLRAHVVKDRWRMDHAEVYWLPGQAGWPGPAPQARGPNHRPAPGPMRAVQPLPTGKLAGVRAWCVAPFLVLRGGITAPIPAADGAIIP
jgi:hypothetical protein